MCTAYEEGFDETTEEAATCTRTLVAAPVDTSAETCWVDAVVTEEAGVLTFPCDGGSATATFGDRSFYGVVDGDDVELCATTEFEWSDGCSWLSAQHISGTLSSGQLEFSYTEAPEAEQADCDAACDAATTISMME
jgi:hypothetical protein